MITNVITPMNLVSFCRTLGDSTRWRIIRLVSENTLCVCELSDILDMPQSSVSSHVQVIRKGGLLESERREKWTYFRIHERYLGLLQHLETSFAGTEDLVWHADDERVRQRLEERESSCCPGPVKLASRCKAGRGCDQVGANSL
jgi:ArsR family transcriptional regulator, arsenate/arsenite/antimonite-responsive transcriptional repressor